MRLKEIASCPVCGKSFYPWKPNAKTAGIFCSRRCFGRHRARPLSARFWEKVQKTDYCWNWTGSIDGSGYGRFSIQQRNASAHRVSWELSHGTIAGGLHVLHRCDNPACVNPGHLFLGTHKDNTKDMVAKRRQAAGGRNAHAKLSSRDVAEIRARYEAGGITQISLSSEFGVRGQQISRIVNGVQWKCLLAPRRRS